MLYTRKKSEIIFNLVYIYTFIFVVRLHTEQHTTHNTTQYNTIPGILRRV